jgi:hypothetical protein
MTSPRLSVEVDELEDAVNDALLLLESTLGSAIPRARRQPVGLP